jgi:hypothetical protein
LKQISDRGEGIATYNTFRRYTPNPTMVHCEIVEGEEWIEFIRE